MFKVEVEEEGSLLDGQIPEQIPNDAIWQLLLEKENEQVPWAFKVYYFLKRITFTKYLIFYRIYSTSRSTSSWETIMLSRMSHPLLKMEQEMWRTWETSCRNMEWWKNTRNWIEFGLSGWWTSKEYLGTGPFRIGSYLQCRSSEMDAENERWEGAEGKLNCFFFFFLILFWSFFTWSS